VYTCLSFVALHLQGESLLHCVERAHVLQHLPHDGELRVEERVDPLTLAVTHGVVAIDRQDRSAAVYHILTTRITLASDPSCRVDRFEDGPHSRVGLCAFLVGIDPTRWEGWTK